MLPVVAAQPSARAGTGVTEKVADFSVGKQQRLRAFQIPETSLLTLPTRVGR